MQLGNIVEIEITTISAEGTESLSTVDAIGDALVTSNGILLSTLAHLQAAQAVVVLELQRRNVHKKD